MGGSHKSTDYGDFPVTSEKWYASWAQIDEERAIGAWEERRFPTSKNEGLQGSFILVVGVVWASPTSWFYYMAPRWLGLLHLFFHLYHLGHLLAPTLSLNCLLDWSSTSRPLSCRASSITLTFVPTSSPTLRITIGSQTPSARGHPTHLRLLCLETAFMESWTPRSS